MNNLAMATRGFSLTYEVLKKKRKCTTCRTKLVDGTYVSIVYTEKGKVKGYFCSDTCIRDWTP